MTKGVNTDTRLCGVCLMMSAKTVAEKRSLKGKSWNCKNDFLKVLICVLMVLFIMCAKIKHLDGVDNFHSIRSGLKTSHNLVISYCKLKRIIFAVAVLESDPIDCSLFNS